MASIAIMAGGAILNAAAFIGGNYLAKAFGGGDSALDEKVRHDKALEAYQAVYAKYSRDCTKLDVPQVLISTAAIFGIGLIWYDFNVKVFNTVRDL